MNSTFHLHEEEGRGKTIQRSVFKLDNANIKTKQEATMGKKHRNRINSPKKNNHIPPEAIVAEQEAHGKEFSATGGRKRSNPGQ